MTGERRWNCPAPIIVDNYLNVGTKGKREKKKNIRQHSKSHYRSGLPLYIFEEHPFLHIRGQRIATEVEERRKLGILIDNAASARRLADVDGRSVLVDGRIVVLLVKVEERGDRKRGS